MGDMSVFASKFTRSSISLKEYDEVLRYLKKNKTIAKTEEIEERISNILKVIDPISEVIEGKLSRNTVIDERSIVRTIKQKHEKEWYSYKKKIIDLNSKLRKIRFTLTDKDFDLLNDIADALDIECGYLFKRLSEV